MAYDSSTPSPHGPGTSRPSLLAITALLVVGMLFSDLGLATEQSSGRILDKARLDSIIESLMGFQRQSVDSIEPDPNEPGSKNTNPNETDPNQMAPTRALPTGSIVRQTGVARVGTLTTLEDQRRSVRDHSLDFAQHDLSASLRRALQDSVLLERVQIDDSSGARTVEANLLDPRVETHRLKEEQRIDHEVARLIALQRALGLAQSNPLSADDLFVSARSSQELAGLRESEAIQKANGVGAFEAAKASYATGAVAGRVLRADGSPIFGAEVLLSDDQGDFVALVLTDRTGSYLHGEVPSGGYRASVRARNLLDPTPGNPVTVHRGLTTRYDIRGTDGASASGTVRDTATDLPIEGILVYAVGLNEAFRGSDFTDALGNYEIAGLPDGDTWFHTNGSLEYVDEANGDVECIGGACAVSFMAQPIVLDASLPAPIVDFNLDAGGAITTLITDEDTGDPLNPIYSELYRASFEAIRGVKRNEPDGSYRSYTVPPGQYLLQFYDSQNLYQREAYDDAPCGAWSCDLTGATPITVVAGQTTPITVALGRAASISGTVVDDVSGTPVASHVTLYDAKGYYVSDAIVRTTGTTAGQFRIAGMQPGTYYLTVFNNEGYFWEIYDDIRRDLYSDVTTGQPIVVTEGQQIENIDFALTKAGAIRGSIKEETSGDFMPWEYLYITDLEGLAIAINARADGNGDFVLQPLEPGSYRVATRAHYLTFINEFWEDVRCAQLDCDADAATPLVITADETIDDVDFALLYASALRGRVTDAVTGTPIADAAVFADAGPYLSTTTAADGTFELTGLHAATYSVWVSHPEYQRQAYGGSYCRLYCDETSGVLVTLPQETTVSGIDFALERGGTVSGTITSESSGEPLGAVYLGLYNNSALLTELKVTAPDGTYRFPGVPLNSGYYLSTMLTPEGYLRETWDDMPALFYPFREEVVELLYGRRIEWATGATETANMALDDDTDGKTVSFEFAAGTGGGSAAVLFNQCASDCDLIGYPTGSVLTLWALPAPNSELDHWSGDPDCADGVITMTEDRTCVVHFRLKPDEVFTDGFESGDLTGWLP